MENGDGDGEEETNEQNKYERKVVNWVYFLQKNFNKLGQYRNIYTISENYNDYITEDDYKEGLELNANKFESSSTQNGKQEIVQKGDYTFIGPYNFKIMGGKISEISIKTSETETINAGPNDKTIYVSIDGENIIKMDQIKENDNLTYTNYSGDSFYIVYKGKISRAKEIKIKRTKEGYRARLVTIEAIVEGQDNIVFDGAPAKEETYLKLPGATQSKGSLKVIKVDKDNNEIKLKNVKFIIYNKDTKKYVLADNNYVTTGYTDNKSGAKVFTTGETGEFEVKNLKVGTYIAYETENPNFGYVIDEGGFEKWVVADKTEELKAENKLYKGNLKLIKVDKNTKERLANVAFKIRNEETKKYVYLKPNKEVKYVDNEKYATEFITDEKGVIEINDLIVGTYKAYETKNPNAGYEIIKDGIEKNVEIDKTAELVVENEQKYIRLSGYVWKDVQSGKQSVRNNLFDNNYDAKDELLEGIRVNLKYKGEGEGEGKVIATTTTNSNGAYSFINVEIDKLKYYDIEFVYSGLIYENVSPNLNENLGSKAIEGEDARTKFNNKFAEITYDTKIDGHLLEYKSENRTSILTNGDEFTINATTKMAKLNIEDKYKPGMTKIENLNLGLYEREQPDLAVMKDIENVKVAVNGYEHTYKYSSRFLNEGDYLQGGFNVGVKFGEKYGNAAYSRAIYKADYNYENSNDRNKELKTYITYKIAIGNLATGLTSKVNSIVDYYDSRYELVAAGTELNETTQKIEGTMIEWSNDDYDNDQNYKKAILNTGNLTIDGLKYKDIYVQFSLSKDAIKSIFFDANGKEVNEKILLDNVAEINSYATYRNGELYAGVDKNSRPGNAKPGSEDTYENDTGAAPALQIECAEARKINGTVFLDSTPEELSPGEERLGDGKYDEGETTIPGVTVKLVNVDDGSVVQTTVTDENGNFELSEFMPGNYKIVYTWGDETYTVEDYKGTIYIDNGRLGNSSWYTVNEDVRYSDAIDNYETRKKIDSGNNPEITKMDSETQVMNLGIEKTLENITPGIDGVQFLIKNVDFGIVERPRQKIDISKDVTAVRITAGETELVNVNIIKENGEYKVDGKESKLLQIVQDSQKPTQKPLLWAFIDDELMNTSTIQIEYTISVANNSELDYSSEDYYKFGTDKKNPVTVTLDGVYDYLDKEMALDPEKDAENDKWETIKTEEYTNIIASDTEPTIIDEYITQYASTTNNQDGSITTIEGFETFMEEYSEQIIVAERSILKEARKTMAMDKTILHNTDLKGKLEAGKSKKVKLYTSKKLYDSEEIDLNNSAEITKVERNTETGKEIIPRTSTLFTKAIKIVVTPPTGDNHNYVLPISLGLSLVAILGAGIILIKKKVLNK